MGEATLLQVLAPRDDMGAGDGAQLGDAAQAGEGDKLLDIDLVGAAGFGVGDIGEPFEFGRDFGERAELGGTEGVLPENDQVSSGPAATASSSAAPQLKPPPTLCSRALIQ